MERNVKNAETAVNPDAVPHVDAVTLRNVPAQYVSDRAAEGASEASKTVQKDHAAAVINPVQAEFFAPVSSAKTAESALHAAYAAAVTPEQVDAMV